MDTLHAACAAAARRLGEIEKTASSCGRHYSFCIPHRVHLDDLQSLEELAPIDQHLEKQHQEKTKVKNINVVEMGKFEMDTWCAATTLLI